MQPTSRTEFCKKPYGGPRVYLQLLQPFHRDDLHAFKVVNRDFFQPYAPLQTDEQFSIETQQKTILQAEQEADADQAYRFGILLREDHTWLGQLNLTGIIRGAFHNALLGYSMDQRHNGKGYMTEAVKLSLELAFDVLGLHRVQAAVMPHNVGSLRVLRKNSFLEEGLSRQYLRINGKWEDHLLFARLNEHWQPT